MREASRSQGYNKHEDFRVESWRISFCIQDIVICKNMMYLIGREVKVSRYLVKHFDDDYLKDGDLYVTYH